MSFNFMAAITFCSDLGTQKIKSVTVSTVSPYISHEVMGPDAMILVFWNNRYTNEKQKQNKTKTDSGVREMQKFRPD